jgi:hypothetical protein
VFHCGTYCAQYSNHVDDQPQRRLDREAPGVLRHVLLEDVVLHRAAQQLVGPTPCFSAAAM